MAEVVVKQVDVMGLMGALRTKGEAKLSDFATPVGNESSSINNQNSKTMAENVNAQQYVGKVIIVGENIATITIKGVKDNGNLDGEFRKGNAAPIPMAVTIANLKGMVERGVWRFEGEATATESKDDVQEVEDVQPTPKTEPKAEKPKTEKPKKSEKPKAEPKPKAEETSRQARGDKGGLTYETYVSKKGKNCARIKGFAEDHPAYVNAADLHASASWDNTKDGKVFYLSFGHRYAEAAKAVCEALNSGKSLADCKAIIDNATQERQQKREEWKANKAAEGETKPKAKTYTEAQVEGVVRKAFGALADVLKTDAKEFEPLITAAMDNLRAAA